MHVEICTSSRINLWDLLDSVKGTKQYAELVECLPSKNLRNHEESSFPQAGGRGASERPSDATLTIANIRKGQNLALSKLPFLWKMHEMLEDVEKTGDDHIVSWLPHGRGFRVHKPKSFVQKIIPHYFKQSKYKSFQRQLHLYDFVRTPRGVEAGAYSHPKFLRGSKSLCLSLSPHKIKGRKPHQQSVQAQGGVLNENVYPSLGKRLREGAHDDGFRGSRNSRNSSFILNNLRCNTSTERQPLVTSDGSFDWKQVQSMLVTGASLAAELEERNSRPVIWTSTTCCPSTTKPHSGDVVYAFGERPFRFIEDAYEKGATLGACCDEPDDVLLSDQELGCLIEESMDTGVDVTPYTDMVV